MARSLTIETAEVFEPLLAPARWKAAWGGRGSGKSHFFAGLLIEDSLAERGLLSVCIREVQKDLSQSSKRLLESKLSSFRLGEADGFKVFKSVIETPGDGVITFQGMQDHTADSVKSLEGFKRAWIEEAQSLSRRSLTLLTPTIRSPGSQLLASWNPRRKSDAIEMLRASPPTGSVVVRANWSDNPWLTRELNQERLDCLRSNPDQYGHIWEGEFEAITDGAYFATQIAAMKKEGRLSVVAPDPLLPVRAFFDIGGTGARADARSIWLAQFVGLQIRVVGYRETQGQPLADDINWLRGLSFPVGHCVLPHDGATNDRVYAVSYQSALEAAGFSVEVIPNQGRGAASLRIEAVRRVFPQVWMDTSCEEAGLAALAAYHEKKDEVRGIGLGPEHDWSSHGADAFGLMAIYYEQNGPGSRASSQSFAPVSFGGAESWMGA
jgi:phage terminase large subunit